MLNSRSIQGILALIVALFFVIWLGPSIATIQLETTLLSPHLPPGADYCPFC